MTVMHIRTLGDPVLRETATPVVAFDETLRRLADDMVETMHAAPGVGLAANQVGLRTSCFVYDDREGHAGFVANPELSDLEDEDTFEEGCLSIPDFTAEIERPAKIRVAYIDREGKPEERELAGIWSTLVQHEIDHLNGILFIDYLSRLKRDMVVRKFSKQKRGQAL